MQIEDISSQSEFSLLLMKLSPQKVNATPDAEPLVWHEGTLATLHVCISTTWMTRSH